MSLPEAALTPQEVLRLLQEGLSHHREGRLEEAAALYARVLVHHPANFDALHLTGVVELRSGRPEAALPLLERAVQADPRHQNALHSLASAQRALGHLDAALASLDAAILLAPGEPAYHLDRGNVLRELGRREEALASFGKAVELRPDAAGYNNLGNILQEDKRFEAAVEAYRKALALDPEDAATWSNFGAALRQLGRLQQARESLDKAVALAPASAQAHNNRAGTLREARLLTEALESYDRALAIDPDLPGALGMSLYLRMQLCAWDELAPLLARLDAGIAGGKPVVPPFAFLGLSDNPCMQKAVGAIHARKLQQGAVVPMPVRRADGKIRIGYFSSDLHSHATAHLIAEMLESHDRDRFEVTAFSFGPERADDMRRRLATAVDRFVDVRRMSDPDIAKLARESGIDIAVDLKGFTYDSRPGIFAQRCAPVQVNYLGYPGTMGAEFMDYIIADPVVIPPGAEGDYTEKVVRLPHCYQANDSKRAISQRVFTRAETGLPESAFVFCCFNNNYKITPGVFAGWMRILRAVPGSVLWLLQDNPMAAENLVRRARAAGVDGARLVFAPRMPLAEHLARHRLADLFLDTLPYNAHTTASDALWAGVPVLTRCGRSFASRVAASLLTTLGLPELIADSQAGYEERAIRLARDPVELSRLKQRLEAARASSPLFDGKRFARHIEMAFEAMVGRHRAGLPPAHLDIGGAPQAQA